MKFSEYLDLFDILEIFNLMPEKPIVDENLSHLSTEKVMQFQ